MPSMEYFMDIAERASRFPEDVKSLAEIEDVDGHMASYNKRGKMLEPIFTDKSKRDTEGYYINKRNQNGSKDMPKYTDSILSSLIRVVGNLLLS